MKFDFVDAQPTAFDVAPLVGAWIEITLGPMKTEYRTSLLSWIEIFCDAEHNCRETMSLLSWERGLKFFIIKNLQRSHLVAPLVGAWIEIKNSTRDMTP